MEVILDEDFLGKQNSLKKNAMVIINPIEII